MVRKATIASPLWVFLGCLLVTVFFSPAFFLPACAQESIGAGETGGFEDSLDLLSRNKYSLRQQGTIEMWRQREQTRDQVQEAARHPDPEVAGRAQWILRQWRRGSLPDTPPEISRLLKRGDGPTAIERLLEGGQYPAAVVAIEESAGTVDREAIQKRISSAMMRRFPVYLHHALERDTLHDLLQLIELVADSKEMAVSRLQLMQHMGIEFDEDDLLPDAASNWSAIDRERAMVLVLMTLGRVDEAIQVARHSSDKDLLHQCRMIDSRWDEAVQDSVTRARESEPGSYKQTHLWCLTLIAADRARNDALVAEAVNQLTSMDGSDDLAAELRWKCLASHGEVEAAFAILDKLSPDASASVSIDASRTGRAFDVLGYPLEEIDRQLESWVDEAIAEQRDDKSDELSPSVRRVMVLMQCLLSVGRDDAAWVIAERLCQSDVMVASLRLREFVLSTLTMTKRTDWIILLAVAEEQKTLTSTTHNTISRTLTDSDAITFEIVMRALSTILPGQTLQQRVEATCQLFNGEIPDGFDPQRDFQRLFDFVTGPRPPTRMRGRFVLSRGALANMNIVSLFARQGQADLATVCLQKLAQGGDIKAMFFLAEQELDGGRAETSQTLFRAVIQAVADQGRTTRRSGSRDDVTLAVKSLIGCWVIARRSGDDQLAAELEREVRLALCSPSTYLRSTIASYLGERGESKLALEVFEVLLPMTVFGNEEQTGLYDVARSYSLLARETNAAEAARWFDLAVSATLDSMNFRPGAYITLPLYVRRWSMEAAIEDRELEEVRLHLDRILTLDPLDIDFAERLLPEMRKAGMEDLADRALDQIMERGLEYTSEFPFDAMTCNNLAWVAAMNERRLDDALKLSELAVFVEPDSAIYRDTLAEVLFLSGRKLEALQVEQGCLLDDPRQWHLHEQVEKYEAAISEDDPSNP